MLQFHLTTWFSVCPGSSYSFLVAILAQFFYLLSVLRMISSSQMRIYFLIVKNILSLCLLSYPCRSLPFSLCNNLYTYIKIYLYLYLSIDLSVLQLLIYPSQLNIIPFLFPISLNFLPFIPFFHPSDLLSLPHSLLSLSPALPPLFATFPPSLSPSSLPPIPSPCSQRSVFYLESLAPPHVETDEVSGNTFTVFSLPFFF